MNYGAQVGHVPYIQVLTGPPPASDSSAAPFLTRYYQRTYISQAAGIAALPLNTSQRFEAEAGYQRIGYGLEYDRFILDGQNIVYEGRESVPNFEVDALNLAVGGLAFVGDYSYFGFSSPVRGGRYRFGVNGTVGSLDYATVTADYRQYLFMRPPGIPDRFPITLAVRGMHYGRYGPDSETGRLYPLYLGYGTLVRGYSSGSFNDDQTYTEFIDRLYGNRIAVAGAELRMPILGVPSYGLINFPYIPTELVLFADAGMAWGTIDSFSAIVVDENNEQSQITVQFGTSFSEQRPVASVGASLRLNLLGAIVLEPYYAIPLSRNDVSGVIGLNFSPGW